MASTNAIMASNHLLDNEAIQHTRLTSKNATFKYAPLDEFISKDSFNFTGIVIPDGERSSTVKVYLTNSPTPQYFHDKNEVHLVQFRIEGKPYDTPEGKKLIVQAPELVRKVLSKDYEPQPATLSLLNKDSKGELETRTIGDCILTGVDIDIDKELNHIKLVFHLQGLLNRPF